MRPIVFGIAVAAILFACAAMPALATESYILGEVTSSSAFRFNNENWFTLPHPKVASFSIEPDGSSFGLTETGVPFSQYNIPNAVGIRVQRFEIEDHFHYIVEGEPVYTFADFSARLSKAYQEKQSA